ncbi:hypothetical protein OCU04_003926 [Sclerotinia nivalis]|uniref:Uncharacterized protein n=1 Tax=Sclerotinia nivalis TaxID=352851 RepID=A0A9X0ATQ1_9HELO|nr:hypothetical protein OCU04_003926 [Sclerotinia nivalis]
MRGVPTHDEVFVTVLTGKGRYFSARADLQLTHPKILITGLNGLAVGLSAALIAFSDFIHCTPQIFLWTLFSNLGLVAEGGASRAFVQRLGISKANEALVLSKRITAEGLLQVGFVNKIFGVQKGEVQKIGLRGIR